MNAVVERKTGDVAMPRHEMVAVLQSSLYPGAKAASVDLVLAYCQASGLDPMLKPVHIVPMKVKVGDKFEQRDTIMPGVGLYRINAARTSEYSGCDEPVFGPAMTLKFIEKTTTWRNGQKSESTQAAELTYPEWCSVTVHRIVAGQSRAFTAKEFWLENYATASAYSTEPNAMWKKRTRGQIAKVAEAQALRKAFPESASSQPTADETLIGPDLQSVFVQEDGSEVMEPAEKAMAPARRQPAARQEEAEPTRAPAPSPAPAAPAPAPAPAPADASAEQEGEESGECISAGELKYLENKTGALLASGIEQSMIDAMLARHGIKALSARILKSKFVELRGEIQKLA